MQEVVVSKRTTLFYGDEEIDWDDVFAPVTSLAIAVLRWRQVDPFQSLQRAWSLVALRNQFAATTAMKQACDWPEPPLQQFSSFLLKSVGHSCKDERDRIYALASLCPAQQSQLIITPDYTKSVEDVYTDFDVQYIQAEGLDLVYLAGLNQRSNPKFAPGDNDVLLPRLPSWIPEYRPSEGHPSWYPWDTNVFSSCLCTGPKAEIFRTPAAMLTVSAHTVDRFSLSIAFGDSSQQDLTGEDVTTISRLESVRKGSTCIELWKELKILKTMLLSFFPDGKYITGEDIRAVIVRTVLADAADPDVAKLVNVQCGSDANEEDLIRVWDVYETWDCKEAVSNMTQLAEMVRVNNHGNRLEMPDEIEENSLTILYFVCAAQYVLERTQVFFTRGGYIGLAPGLGRSGDVVLQIPGMKVPFLARRVPIEKSGNSVMLIGQCYVHGIMYGENLSEVSMETCSIF